MKMQIFWVDSLQSQKKDNLGNDPKSSGLMIFQNLATAEGRKYTYLQRRVCKRNIDIMMGFL